MTLRLWWAAVGCLLGALLPALALAADACPDANADRLDRYRAGSAAIVEKLGRAETLMLLTEAGYDFGDVLGADVLVVGAGAAGLWCAEVAARGGRDVLVLETDELDYIHDLVHRLDVMERIEAVLPPEMGKPAC